MSGAVYRPGVYEIELGTPIGQGVAQAGGPAEPLQALLVGGYFGAWLPVGAALPLPMTHAALKAAGGALGAGMVIALPASSCLLAETARVARYLADESAGQCGPCMFRAGPACRATRCLPASGRGYPAHPQRAAHGGGWSRSSPRSTIATCR